MPSKSELLKLVSVKESLENYTQNCQYSFSLKCKILGYFQYEKTIHIFEAYVYIYICLYMREILCLKFYKSFFDNHETKIKEKDLMISSEYAYHVTSLALSHFILLRTYRVDLISLYY